MNNRTLINLVQPTLQALSGNHPELDYDGAETTAVKYAIVKNQNRAQEALEDYQQVLQDLFDEHDADPKAEELPDDPDFQSDLQELLDQPSDFQPYQITEDKILKEENIPMEVLGAADQFLIE